MTTQETEKSVSLYSEHAGSNKEYHVYLRQQEDKWVVNYAYGAVGKPLKSGTKTQTPTTYEQALKKFNALVKEKKEGDSHYTEGEAGVQYQSPTSSKTLFGVFPQQPSPINRQELEALLEDDDWGLQEKANGDNRTVRMQGGVLTCGNKKGFVTPAPLAWEQQFAALGDFVANGEHVGEVFFAFDLLELDGQQLQGQSQECRYQKLKSLLAPFEDSIPLMKLLPCFYSVQDKRKLLRDVELAKGEGVVAKHRDAVYSDGRNKNTRKFVFSDVVTCIVTAQNEKRSVQIGLLSEQGVLTSCGNVTIPTNKPVPQVGDLIDLQYLYLNKGGAFEIPVYDPNGKGPRTDVDRAECTFDQVLRFKPAALEETTLQAA